MRLLLVEDDEDLGDGLRRGLIQNGYAVDWFKDGLSALQAIRSEHFDICVLDLGLPKVPGLLVLQQLREAGILLPVLILTARETTEDRVKGLDMGADDYLVKPVDLDELCARLRALQRRATQRAGAIIHHNTIVLDPASHIVTLDGEEINIPRREFALLHKLLDNVGTVLSRDQLTQTLYGWGDEIDSNALEVHIHNLRKKFGVDFVRTIRGVGYLVESEKE